MGKGRGCVRPEPPNPVDLMFSLRADAQIPRVPLLDQRGPACVTRAADDGSRQVAEYVERGVTAHLHARMRRPSGRYLSTIHVRLAGSGWLVDGNGTVYGPWLEGTGSRNYPNTRFKGYRAFRVVTGRVRTRVVALAWPAVQPWFRRLTGS